MRNQHGIALVTSLIFLSVLMLLGVAAFNMSSLETRMSGAYTDRVRAHQNADSALRDAEQYIVTLNGLQGFNPQCDNGLCYNGPTGFPKEVWTVPGLFDAKSIEYGKLTDATPLPDVIAQPRYLVEGFRKLVAGQPLPLMLYRITVRARGKLPGTLVTLQEVYRAS